MCSQVSRGFYVAARDEEIWRLVGKSAELGSPVFLGLPDPHPDTLVKGADRALDPPPDPSIIK